MERKGPDASPRFHRWLARAWVAALWLPLLQMVHPVLPEGLATVENRRKAPPPAFHGASPAALKRSAESLERYVNDNFGFRDSLIIASNKLHVRLLRTSPLPDVVIGEEGWLYYNGPAGTNLADYAGLEPLPGEDLLAIEGNLVTLGERLRRRGTAFALLVAPDKHTIYPEHLPPRIRALGGDPMRLDQLLARVARRPGIVVADVRDALRAGKARFPVYYRTDTHWNGYGAHVASRVVFEALARAGAPVVPLPPESDYVISSAAVAQTDLLNMLGLPGSAQEQNFAVSGPTPRQVATRQLALPPAPRPGWETMACTTGDGGLPRTLLLQDSFGQALWPELCQNSSQGVLIWGYQLSEETLDRERPDIVVLEVVERNLAWLADPRHF